MEEKKENTTNEVAKVDTFYDVECVVKTWTRKNQIWDFNSNSNSSSKKFVPSSIQRLIGVFRGYQSAWDPVAHGSNMRLESGNAYIATTYNKDGTSNWKGNTIRTRQPLFANSGIHSMSITFRFITAPGRVQLQSGYFIGLIRGRRRNRKNANSNDTVDVSDYNLSICESKSKLKHVYGIEFRRNKCFKIEGSKREHCEEWKDVTPLRAFELCTLEIDMNQFALTLFQNDNRLDKSAVDDVTREYDMLFAKNDAERNAYEWHVCASVWHTDVQCHLQFFDHKAVKGWQFDSNLHDFVFRY